MLLAGNGSRVRFFRGPSPIAKLEEIDSIENPTIHQYEREVGADRPGRQFDASGPARSAVREPTHKDQSVDEFAQRIADFLAEQHEAGQFEDLSIVAAPALLGRLRTALKPALRRRVLEEIDKDLTLAPPDEIQNRLTRLRR